MNDFELTAKKCQPEKVVFSVRIDSKKLDAIDKYAAQANISRNEFVVQCIEYAIKNLKQKG